MAHILGRLKRQPRLWGGLLTAVVALLLAFTGRARDDDAAVVSHRMAYAPFELSQSFAGRIFPGEQIEILAPADATLTAINFSFGERVSAGQVLYQLDEGDVWRKQAEARIGYLQAAEAARTLQSWDDGPEMANARRAVSSAEQQLEDAVRKRDEALRLFEKGLIARTEMDGLHSAHRQARQALEVAQEELVRTQARGRGIERQVVELQHGVAAGRLADAAGTGAALIRAPRDGVMVRAASRAMGESKAVAVGVKVNQGQSLGVVAALDALDVVFRVDEADLAYLDIGAPARVSGPGFAGRVLHGVLANVAGEAEAAAGSDRTVFEARVRLKDLDPEALERLRIGMTAHVQLQLYHAPRALAVPLVALIEGGPRVQVRASDGRVEIRRVTLGRIGPDQAQVLSGLREGEEVIWSVP